MFKRCIPVLAALAVLAGIAACSTDESGTAVPSDSKADQNSSIPSSVDESESADSVSVANLDPCSLVTDSEADKLGTFAPKKPENSVGVPGCLWGAPRGSYDQTFFGNALWDNASIDQVNDEGAGVEYAEMNGRKVARIPTVAAGSACTVALAVGKSERVDISATSKDVKSACELAEKVATVVEPKLPEG